MDYQKLLLSKNGLAIMSISKEFLKYHVGNKISTVSEMCQRYGLSRGTIQSAMATLEETGAIFISRHGHLGSVLTKKDTALLLRLAGISMLVGAMPLPYSRKYEGLATGLISSMETAHTVPVALSYMRGAISRIAMVVANRYDFAIVSKYAAEEFLQEHPKTIDIIKEFGPHTYCSSHVVIFHDPKKNEIEDGMSIGIDADSIDQNDMTRFVCKGKKVKYYPVEYSSLLQRVAEGKLDATVWNEDEIKDKMSTIHYCPVAFQDGKDTNAVIVCNHQEPEIGVILDSMIDLATVSKIQTMVEKGIVTPSY